MAQINARILVMGGKFDGFYWETADGGAQWYDPTGLAIQTEMVAQILATYALDGEARAWRPLPA